MYKGTGLSEDARIRDLQLQLCDLAADFSGATNPDEVAKQYRNVVLELYASGWDGIIAMDCELPVSYMPTEYLSRNPEVGIHTPNDQWRSPTRRDP